MKKRFHFNLLFFTIPILVYGLVLIYINLNRSSATFFGVAENQETQINLEHASSVNQIYVSEGKYVKKGTLLLKVTRSALDFKLSALSHDIAELSARDRLTQNEIRSSLEKYIALRAQKVADIQSRIRLLESEKVLNQNLFVDLKSIPKTDTIAAHTIYNTKLQTLRDELNLAIQPLDIEIARLQQELKMIGIPAQMEISKMKREVDLYSKEQEQLQILAPADGLVGGIHCQPGENIQAFNTLISFYEQNPNTVVAYLHESLSTELAVGDSLLVRSTLHPEENCKGRVSGLGHRIVEIPERLRKLPEIKSYGREVLIQISAENHFLQKEKVMLERLHAPTLSGISFFPKSLSASS